MPELVEAPRLKAIDAAGIDLLIWSDDVVLPLVVQCKGYRKDEIADDQIRQAKESLEAFLDSGLRADRYVLVHNRDGRNRMREKLSSLLEECKRRRVARTAEIWDREQLVDIVFDAIADDIRVAISRYSEAVSSHLASLFTFRSARITHVPVLEQTAVFRRDAAGYLTPTKPKRRRNVAQVLRKSSGQRWTILTGTFGTGKTTAALAAAHDAATPVLFIPIATISPHVFRSGIRADLLVHINEVLGVASNDGDSSEASRSRIAASVLAHLLRGNNSDVTLVLDGLDEHHELATPQGITKLLNQVAAFQGPVVLTTRKEHLDALFGSFNAAMAGLSLRWGREREARVLQLVPWSGVETAEVIRLATSSAARGIATRLKRLLKLIEDGAASPFYGDLLTYPLFVQFILEDVAEHGVRMSSRASLIASFVERKIRRDLIPVLPDVVGHRAEVAGDLDPDTVLDLTLEALERVAAAMTIHNGREVVLLEDIDAEHAAKIFSETFGRSVGVVPMLLNSVLITTCPRSGRNLRVAFALRILQEYFVAAALVRTMGDREEYSHEIGRLADEISAAHLPSSA